MHCVEICPVGIEHVPTIVQLRRSLVDNGTMGPTLQQALQNLAAQGNSFGRSARRGAGGSRTGLPDPRCPQAGGEVPVVRRRLRQFRRAAAGQPRALAGILHAAGVDFGLLYEAERNAGNDVRRVGEEGLFEMLAEHNIEALREAQFEEIFTTDPHTLNALRNEYPALGASYQVRHYTELLAQLLESGAIVVRPLGYRVTYHDPCYLARYNGVIDAPRRILRALGCELVEMPRHGVDSFCCGAGGGRIWMDDSLRRAPEREPDRRGAPPGRDQFVVACPKDATMFADAVKTTGADDRRLVRDITMLVQEAMLSPERVRQARGVGVTAGRNRREHADRR